MSTKKFSLGDRLSIFTQRRTQRINTHLLAVFGHLEKSLLKFYNHREDKRIVTHGDGNDNTTCFCNCILCATAVWLMKKWSIYSQLLTKKTILQRKRKESDQPNKRILLFNITVLHNMDIIS